MEDVSPYESIRELPFNFIDRKIGILIGMNLPQLAKPLEIVNTSDSGIFAIRYLLGWAVCGPGRQSTMAKTLCLRTKAASLSTEGLEQKIDSVFSSHLDFHDDEGIGPSQDEVMWERRVAEGTKVVDNLNYEICLPCRDPNFSLPNNCSQVHHRLIKLRKQLLCEPDTKEEYIQFMRTMINRGFVECVPETEIFNNEGKIWYIAHHAVRHPQKNKLRVVYDYSLM